MSSKVWSIGLQKYTKIIQHHVPIRSTDQDHFKQVGVCEIKAPTLCTVSPSKCKLLFSLSGSMELTHFHT